jgi:FkbM family methyltransferase
VAVAASRASVEMTRVGRGVVSVARAIARGLIPKPARSFLRKAWRDAQRSRRRVKARRGKLLRRFEIVLPSVTAATFRSEVPAVLRIEATNRLSIPRRLERGGLADFEPEGIGCVLALLERIGAGTFFDVGANIAPYSFVAAALTRWSIVAFEPTPKVAKVARRIRDINGLNYSIEELALDEKPGNLPLYISTSSDTSSSLRSSWRPWERTVTVRVETLDGYCARMNAWPSVLKIDTETTEPAVLRGGRRLLEEHRPWIVCEVLKGHTEAELEEIIEPLGYYRYHIRDGGTLALHDRLAGEAAVFRDWLLAPEPVDAGLAAGARKWAAALLECRPIVATTK